MRSAFTVIVILLAVGAVVALQAFYTVDVTEQVIVTQFGQFKRAEREAGIHFKTPFLEEITRFSKRVLRYDQSPTSLITSDKKNLIIDAYARYKIVDPLRAFQTVRDERGADTRVGSIISSELRKNVASHTQSDIISLTRAQMMRDVTSNAAKEAGTLGIELLDVRVKRADFPPEVAESIFARMNAERNRAATQFRAEGAEEQIKIKAEAEKRKTILLAEAKRQAQVLRGEGEAEAIKVYAEALQQDPEFYAFTRSLDAYKEFLATQATVVLSSESELFRFLASPSARPVLAQGGGR